MTILVLYFIFREPKAQRQYPDKATFTEFVEFHLSGGTGTDAHFAAYVKRCGFCNREFNVIGTVETMAEDTE